MNAVGRRGAELKVVITNYTGDRQNWGCQSTSRGLERFLAHHLPGVQIATLPLRSQFPRLKGVPRGELRKELLAILRGTSTSPRLLEGVYDEHEIRHLREADLVLFQGEGTMVGTSFYNGENLLVAPIAAAKLFQKPVWSINQTVFSLDETFTKFLVEAYSTAFERNYLREAASLGYLQGLSVPNCALLPDLAFYDTEASGERSVEPGFAAMSGMARIERLPGSLFEETAGALIDRYLKLVFLASTNMDMAMAELLKARFGNGIELVMGSSRSRKEAFSAIQSAKVFVSGRYHMNIFSAKAGTPFIPFLSNTHKNLGLTQMLGYPIAPRLFSEDYSLLPDLERVERERAVLSTKLRNSSEAIRCFLDGANIFSQDGAKHDFADQVERANAAFGEAESSYFQTLNAPKKKMMS